MKNCFRFLVLPLFIAVLTDSNEAVATSYTYTNSTATSTDSWSTGTNWSGSIAPQSGQDTVLTFISPNTTVFTTGVAPVSKDDIAGNFSLNSLVLQGTGPASNSDTLTIQGNTLNFVTSSSSVTPTVALNALKGSGTGLTYTVSNNIDFVNDTTFNGAGTATFNFTGLLSGSGALNQNSSSTLTVSGASDFGYTGNVNVTAGTLSDGSGAAYFFTQGGLSISSGATVTVGTIGSVMAVSSLTGSGTVSSASTGQLLINYAGAGDTFNGTIAAKASLYVEGADSFTFTNALTGASTNLTNEGTGTVTAPGLNSAGSAVGSAGGISNISPYGVVKLTQSSTTGTVVTGTGISQSLGGTIWIAPTGTGNAEYLTGQTLVDSASGAFRAGAGLTLKLDKGNNTSLTFSIGGGATSSHPIFVTAFDGSIIVDPVTAGTLGTTTKFVINAGSSTGAVPTLTAGIVNTADVVADDDGNQSADFMTYSGTGAGTSDTGFKVAPYTTLTTPNSFTGTTSSSVVDNSATQSLTTDTLAYALRDNNTITIASGHKLTLGNGTQAGLILNGGTITGGTLAGGTAELTVYTSNANGTIGSSLSDTAANTAVSLMKFGPGTLYLTGANSYSGQTVIDSGALDVGAIGGVLPGVPVLRLNGGVLQGNGSFTRGLVAGTGVTQASVSWDNGSVAGDGGGFAARGGTLTVSLGNSSAAVTWQGSSSSTGFLADNQDLIFGSNTSDSQVNFQNSIDLGTTETGVYYRTIYVNKGTGTDSALISGNISSTATHGLLKDGAGILILSGTNTYTGTTVVNNGLLLVTGTHNAGSAGYNILNGGLLGGAGGNITTTGAVTVANGGGLNISGGGLDITSGISPGKLTITTGNLDLSSAVSSAAATPMLTFALATPTSSDEVFLSGGKLLIGTGQLNLTDFNFTGTPTAGTYILFDTTGPTGITGSLALTGLTGTVNGFAATLAPGMDGANEDITLTLSAVPEPSTYAMMMIGFLSLILWKRRLCRNS